jgi:hypothetical protein
MQQAKMANLAPAAPTKNLAPAAAPSANIWLGRPLCRQIFGSWSFVGKYLAPAALSANVWLIWFRWQIWLLRQLRRQIFGSCRGTSNKFGSIGKFNSVGEFGSVVAMVG